MQLASSDTIFSSRIERLQPGDHICLLHETQERWREFVSAFVRGGIKRDEKVVLLSGRHSPYEIMQILQGDGLEPSKRIFDGQLVVLPAPESGRSEFFDPERVLAFLRDETTKARMDGFAGLRVTGDLTSIVNTVGAEELLLSYEAKLADFFVTHNAIVACQYDRNAFSDEFLLSILDLHPIVVSEGRVLENRIFYSSFHESSGPAAASYKMQERLRVLSEWNYVEQKSGEGLAWIQKLADVAPAGVFLMDPRGNCVYVNDQWCRIAGMSSDEALGMGWTRSIDPADSAVVVSKWTKAIEQRAEFECEYRICPRIRRLHREAAWVSARARTLRGEKGQITGYIGILQDIGPWVAREEGLRESQRWLSSIFRALPAIVSITEVDSGRYLDVNDAFERFSGYSHKEVVGCTPVELGIANSSDSERERQVLLRSSPALLLSPLDDSIESFFRNRSGEVFPVRVSVSLIGSKNGPCVLSVITPQVGSQRTRSDFSSAV